MTTTALLLTALVSGVCGTCLFAMGAGVGFLRDPRATSAVFVACAAVGLVNYGRRRPPAPPPTGSRFKRGYSRD